MCSARQTIPTASELTALEKHVSPNELAEMLGLSVTTLWRMRQRGLLPEPIRVSPGRVAWPESVILRWHAARAAERA